ncbi:MAG TPA: Trm112 family protein [Fimbriimonadaceae bacterium]|nr:Trm112 family protein [Fimbriimonadaceae bacterium]
MIDPEFLAILACPVCDERPPLREEGDILVCTKAGHRFPVKDGIPHLLPEDELSSLTEGQA